MTGSTQDICDCCEPLSPEQEVALWAWAKAMTGIMELRNLADDDPDVIAADYAASTALGRLSKAVEAALAKRTGAALQQHK